MPRGKKELAEQIIPRLREVEVEVERGKTVPSFLGAGYKTLRITAGRCKHE